MHSLFEGQKRVYRTRDTLLHAVIPMKAKKGSSTINFDALITYKHQYKIQVELPPLEKQIARGRFTNLALRELQANLR